MVKPDIDTTTAFAQFSRSAEWRVIEKWLVQNREDCVLQSLSSDDARSRQAQGKILAIDEILRITRAAESVLRR